jgi:hypothetical protein
MKLRLLLQLLLLVLPLSVIQGCSPSAELITTNAIDPAGRLSREDYLTLRDCTPSNADNTDNKNSKIPPIPKLSGEEDNDLSFDSPLHKLVSVTVTDGVPVRDVLMELVRKTGAVEFRTMSKGSFCLADAAISSDTGI